jgi:hypothetical protein
MSCVIPFIWSMVQEIGHHSPLTSISFPLNISRQLLSTKSMIEGRIYEVWNNISVEECKKLIDSMPDRIAAVIKTKEDWTDY